MKILHTVTITIAIILMIIVSPMEFGTLSFAARTNSTGASAQHNNNITASSSNIPNINTSKITTTNPASHNATTSLMGGGKYPCSNTDNFLWNHVWSSSRLTQKTPPLCIRVTGTVYSIHDQSQPTRGTHDEPDGDLHFTLTLDSAYTTYSDRNDCNPPITGCKNIIVEVICHNTPVKSYDQYGKYCDGVKPVYTHGQFPKQGDRLIVEGKFVVDENEHWNEIHPASYVKCIHTDCK